MKICPNCGTQNNDEDNFCEVCGARLPDNVKICPKCGFANDPENSFCEVCGARLDEMPEAEEDTVSPAAEEVSGADKDKATGRNSKSNDELIKAVRALKNGDQEAFGTIYELTNKGAMATIKRYCDSSADYEDILQDTYLKVYQSIGDLRDDSNIKAWINKIAANTAIRANMKKKPTMFSEMEDDEGQEPEFEDESTDFNPEAISDRNAVSEIVREILDTLPDDQRDALWMVYGQRVTIREMAENLGISENTIKSRLYQGRQKMMARKGDFRKYGIELSSAVIGILIAMSFEDTVYAAEIGAAGAGAAAVAGVSGAVENAVAEAGEAAAVGASAGEASAVTAASENTAEIAGAVATEAAEETIDTAAAVSSTGTAAEEAAAGSAAAESLIAGTAAENTAEMAGTAVAEAAEGTMDTAAAVSSAGTAVEEATARSAAVDSMTTGSASTAASTGSEIAGSISGEAATASASAAGSASASAAATGGTAATAGAAGATASAAAATTTGLSLAAKIAIGVAVVAIGGGAAIGVTAYQRSQNANTPVEIVQETTAFADIDEEDILEEIVEPEPEEVHISVESESWPEAFIDYLNSELDVYSYYNEPGYTLIYLDDDDIPELVRVGVSNAEGCTIINYNDGGIEKTNVSLEFGYYERENLIEESEMRMGTLYDNYYSIVDGKLMRIGAGYGVQADSSGYDYEFDENGLPIGFNFEWNDQPVSRQEYAANVNEIYSGHDEASYKVYDFNYLYSALDMINLLSFMESGVSYDTMLDPVITSETGAELTEGQKAVILWMLPELIYRCVWNDTGEIQTSDFTADDVLYWLEIWANFNWKGIPGVLYKVDHENVEAENVGEYSITYYYTYWIDKNSALKNAGDFFGKRITEKDVASSKNSYADNPILMIDQDAIGVLIYFEPDERIIVPRIESYSIDDGILTLSVYYEIEWETAPEYYDTGHATVVFRENPESFFGYSLESLKIDSDDYTAYQTSDSSESIRTSYDEGTEAYDEDRYNEYGLSYLVIDMLTHTLEENTAKYHVKSWENDSTAIFENGIIEDYHFLRYSYVNYLDFPGEEFKYYDPSLTTAREIGQHLAENGYALTYNLEDPIPPNTCYVSDNDVYVLINAWEGEDQTSNYIAWSTGVPGRLSMEYDFWVDD